MQPAARVGDHLSKLTRRLTDRLIPRLAGNSKWKMLPCPVTSSLAERDRGNARESEGRRDGRGWGRGAVAVPTYMQRHWSLYLKLSCPLLAASLFLSRSTQRSPLVFPLLLSDLFFLPALSSPHSIIHSSSLAQTTHVFKGDLFPVTSHDCLSECPCVPLRRCSTLASQLTHNTHARTHTHTHTHRIRIVNEWKGRMKWRWWGGGRGD